MKKLTCILFIALALLAVFRGAEMRLHNLEVRAVHPDEGEQTWTFARLFAMDDYKYNPHGPHGPILYYWPLMFLNDDDINTFDVKDLRRTLFPLYPATALFVFLFAALSLRKTNLQAKEPDLSKAIAAGAFAVLLFSFSSLSQIYSTYFVQEVFFALFALVFSFSFFYFCMKPSLWLACALGVSAGLLQITKETSVFVYAAAFFSAASVVALMPKNEKIAYISSLKNLGISYWLKIFLAFAVPSFIIYAAFYSSFGTNWRGLWDGMATYFIHFFEKSSNPLHSKEFSYYFQLLAGQKREYLFFGESGIFIFAIIGTVFAFVKRNDTARFVAIFAWISLLMMSAIGYKTPWLMLYPLYPLCIAGGIGVAAMLKIQFKPLWAALIVKFALFACALWLFHFQVGLARTASASYPSDPRNIFLYVHTLKKSENLVKRVEAVNRVLDGNLNVLIAMQNSPWPLPWQFARLGCTPTIVRSPKDLPSLDPYSIIIYDFAFDNVFANRFDDDIWLEEYFGLRENLLLRVFVKRDLFEKSIETNPTH